MIAFGEDVGKLGDVNQGFAGLQAKYGELRVADTGIREATIIGQAIGMALRGLRPIAEIQYLDYVLYALQIMSDDLATLRWRTKGRQKAPVIVRTRGHRLEGIWHSGSPMAGMLNLRARHVRLRAAQHDAGGRLLQHAAARATTRRSSSRCSTATALKEKLPANIGELHGAARRAGGAARGDATSPSSPTAPAAAIALEAAEKLAEVGIEVEVIDVQTLLPFDRPRPRSSSRCRRPTASLFLDEDVPGRRDRLHDAEGAGARRAATTGSTPSRAPSPPRSTAPPTARTATTCRSPTGRRSSRRSTS